LKKGKSEVIINIPDEYIYIYIRKDRVVPERRAVIPSLFLFLKKKT